MWASVAQSCLAPLAHSGPGRETENRKTEHKQRKHRHLDFIGLDFLAQVFRRAPHHQPRDEHGKDDEDKHSIESRAYSSENDFTKLNVEQWNASAKRCERIMH